MEGLRVYIVPEGKRDEYVEFIEKLTTRFLKYYSHNDWNSFYDAVGDPIVVFKDVTILPKYLWEFLYIHMRMFKCEDITEQYVSSNNL